MNEDILGDYEEELCRMEYREIILEEQPRILFETVIPPDTRLAYRGFLIANDARDIQYGTVYQQMVFVPDQSKYHQTRQHRMAFMCEPDFKMHLPQELFVDDKAFQLKEPDRYQMVIMDDKPRRSSR